MMGHRLADRLDSTDLMIIAGRWLIRVIGIGSFAALVALDQGWWVHPMCGVVK